MQTHEALLTLLSVSRQRLDLPVGRWFVNPGQSAPHDDCTCDTEGNGQLWVANTNTLTGWLTADVSALTCQVPFTDVIELGIVRCAQSVLQDVDFLPDQELVTNDAIRQLIDKEALKSAILCDWGIEGMDMANLSWNPIEPQGGCVGGTWTLALRNASCTCVEAD